MFALGKPANAGRRRVFQRFCTCWASWKESCSGWTRSPGSCCSGCVTWAAAWRGEILELEPLTPLPKLPPLLTSSYCHWGELLPLLNELPLLGVMVG